MVEMPADWSPHTLFVEIDARDAAVAKHLAQLGWKNYLGVARNARGAAYLQSNCPSTRDWFTTTDERRWVLYNNADVLFLSGSSVLYLWKYRDVRHAQYVAWKLSLHPIVLFAAIGWLLRFVVGQYKWPQLLTWRAGRGITATYAVSRVARPKRRYHDALHFIPHRLQLGGLFRKLRQENIEYVVLRWFESLPEFEPTGDIDLLVADEDFSRVLQILRSGPAIRPCDVYTPSGLRESSYLKASYYPPQLACRLLTNAGDHRGFCRVPSERDYFHSLAYHAIYHKGPESNLPGADAYRRHDRRSSRDFTSILANMAGRLGIDVEISLEGLHEYLARHDWAPPPDLIVRMAASAPRNRWLQELATRENGNLSVDPRLTVFIIRESALDAGVHEQIISMIEHYGFVPLARKRLSAAEVQHGAPRTRGGNWGPGPDDHLGGLPAILLVTYDPNPLPPTRSQRKRFPLVTNAHTLAKEEIRRRVNQLIAPRHPINGVHSSDYGAEAHHFLHVFAAELVPEINEKIAALRGQEAPRRMAA
jgi:hypothetical protein